ncbi:MAG: hypothetical protein COS14_09225, partial [Bacteroidetes bacterium CG02_land_8_20_14_3_00_31_25]
MNIKMFLLVIALSVMLAPAINAQKKNAPKKPIASDCNKAIKINLDKKAVYGPTVAPSGFGEIQEIKSNKKNDKYFFEEEHNSAWYCFNIKTDGTIALTITPLNPKDDYDFILFKYTDSCFCKNIVKSKIIPVRTNISRTGLGGTVITGLSNNEVNLFFCAGKGKPFSKSLDVKKGEKYYLVLDNVYQNGDGHSIEIGYEREASISGIVLNEANKPFKAEVILEDQKGNEVEKTISDSITGKYSFNAFLFVNTNYNIVYLQDSSFVKITAIKSENLVKNNFKLEDIRIVLPKLRKGAKYTMDAINFYPGSTEPLSSAYSSMKSLLRLMKKNPK